MGFLNFMAAEARAEPLDAEAVTDTSGLTGWTTGDDQDRSLAPVDVLALSTVYACVRLIADSVATTPWDVFKPGAKGRREPAARPAWMDQPNAGTRKIKFVTEVMTSLLLEGNAYVLVGRNPVTGTVSSLDVLPATAVEPKYVQRGRRVRELVYELSVTGEDGRVQVVGAFGSSQVLHISGISLAGEIKGVSPLTAARRTFALSLDAQQYGEEFFANGAMPAAVISVPGPMTPEGLANARRTWRRIHGGRGHRHGLAILTEAAAFQKVSVTPDEAQFLQTRQFQVPEITRIFGTPPHLVSDATNSTSWGSGLAEQNTAFVQHTLTTWIARLEEAFSTLAAPGKAFVKFNLGALLRGSLKERLEAYRIALQTGIYTRNEVRAWEDLEPDPSGLGDYLMVPMNLAVLTPDGPLVLARGGNPVTPANQSAPEPGEPGDPDDTEPPDDQGEDKGD
ncbi:phage portal protein [Actinosynnema sp. NPDC020468]|uniref:phage portal protein n=1 Tax=Actinosynnema sp. NPDC020468 TaxID=3154488 RepID=UPI0033DE7D93